MIETKEQRLAKQKMMKETRCRHFTGYQNGKCKAGKCYREIVGGPELGWAARLPCLPESGLRKEPMATCDRYEPKTAEEIVAEDMEIEARTECLVVAIEIIRALKQAAGSIACPKCYSGELRFTVAKSNGHIWGKCAKPDCLSWMM